ncbi:hypothetical protein Tco_0122295 [Tanacetum coccineum]
MSYNEIRPIFEKVWDFNQHIELMKHGSEKMKSPEKIEEKDADTQKEVKEVVKEYGAKRKKSLPKKRRTVKRQKLKEDAEKEELKGLVKERYSASRPEGYDLMLWGDLHTLFEPDEEDEIWKNQHEYNVISWSLYDFCGIHILLMQNGIAIHMLTEKKYPLSQEMISKMLKKKLEVDHESSQAFELLRLIMKRSTCPTYLGRPFLRTARALIDEFADELAHITFPLGNDDLPFDAESDLLELEYLLNHDPSKDMESILEDLVDENSLDDNLDDTISKEFIDELAPSESFPRAMMIDMFTDEHDLDYSSPPLWDDYDDNLFDHETVNDDTYDDTFDFKEEKIKDSKILIDELDLPESNNVLPFPECDSVFYEDFSKVDALSSTNNEDKVFNPGILIHENLFEVTNFATPDKNVKKTTNASLIFEDFNPPLYELLFHKEVLGLGALLLFSSGNEEC